MKAPTQTRTQAELVGVRHYIRALNTKLHEARKREADLCKAVHREREIARAKA